jgi:hypothetical protein
MTGTSFAAAAAVIALCLSEMPANAAPTYTSFDPSGSIATYPTSINKAGVIAGYYEDSGDVYHGFVRATDGTITSFDPPGSTGTTVTGINRAGTIVGYYVDSDRSYEGFERTADGTIATFAANKKAAGTFADGINADGSVVGSWEGPWKNGSTEIGFVRAANGQVQSFRVETHPHDPATVGQSINDAGAVAGSYSVWYYHSDGFTRASDGTISTFEAAGSSWTQTKCINNDGIIVGTYFDVDGDIVTEHSFQRGSDGTITQFDPPGASGSSASCVNDKGTIVGNTDDGKGYLRTASGKFTEFRLPAQGRTFATGINDKKAIIGYYLDKSDIQHGFVRTP